MQNRAILRGFGWARAASVALVIAGFAACGGEDEGGRSVNGGNGNGLNIFFLNCIVNGLEIKSGS